MVKDSIKMYQIRNTTRHQEQATINTRQLTVSSSYFTLVLKDDRLYWNMGSRKRVECFKVYKTKGGQGYFRSTSEYKNGHYQMFLF